MPLRYDPILRAWTERLVAAILALAATLAAMGCIWLRSGLMDGFASGDQRWLGGTVRALLPWALAAALAAGPLVLWMHGLWTRRRPRALGLLFALPRAFATFALYGILLLFAFIVAIVGGALLLGLRRLLGFFGWRLPFDVAAPGRALMRGAGLSLWMIVFPLSRYGGDGGGGMKMPDARGANASLPWLAPWLVALVMLWTGAVSEGTGERVDPVWLWAGASFWLADYLIVAFQVAPRLVAYDGADG